MPKLLERSVDLGGCRHPVDSLGRARLRSDLDRSGISRNTDSLGFRGHAAVFNRRTWIGSKDFGFWEEIAPGAFRKTIAENDIRLLVNHDPNLLLARNRAGTLRLSEDDIGLAVSAELAPVSYARDLATLLERGDISQMSFAFDIIGFERTEAADGKPMIRLTEVRLWDVAVVTFPAYEETDAALRGAAFESLCETLGISVQQRDAMLRRLASGEPTDLLGPAETTPAVPAPAETTRHDGSQPDETGGIQQRKRPRDPRDALRQVRAREHAARLSQES
jgi:hypothetical protein